MSKGIRGGIKLSNGDQIFTTVNYTAMAIFALLCVYPFYYCFMLAFNNGLATMREIVWIWPNDFTLDNFKIVLKDGEITGAFGISVLRTVIGAASSVIFNSMVAYALASKELKFRKVYITIGIITMYFSGGIIPTYILINSLGLINRFAVYILVNLSYFFNIIIFMSFFREIPKSLFEAARMDGAGEFFIYRKIVMPISTPVIATIALFSGVYHWNSWIETYLYITKKSLYTMSAVLMSMIKQGLAAQLAKQAAGIDTGGFTENSIRLAAMVIAVTPILCIYPFLQKYFLKGIMIGAIKG